MSAPSRISAIRSGSPRNLPTPITAARKFTWPSKTPIAPSRYLNAAIRLAPDQPYVYYLRGAAWYDRYMRASDLIQPKDLTRAIADFTKAIHYGPYFAGAYYARGLARSTNGEHDRAVEDFAQAVRLQPNNPQMAAALKRLMP